MTVKKKLKRGLPELSSLFAESKSKNNHNHVPTQPVTVVPSNNGKSHEPRPLVCAGLWSFGTHFGFDEICQLANVVSPMFDDVFLVSLNPERQRYEHLARSIPIATWDAASCRSKIQLEPVSTRVSYAYVPAPELEEVVRPKLKRPEELFLDSKRRALAILDVSSTAAQMLTLSEQRETFLFLDHCVFVVEADLASITEAYEWLRLCAIEHPGLIYSMLLVGKGAKTLWEFVYERLHDMVSKFLAHDLGFLGWIENDARKLNSDLLLLEAGGSTQRATKARLSEALYRAAVHS